MTSVVCENSVTIMHTYKIRVTESERKDLMNALNSGRTVVLSENHSDTCYFIIPADDAEALLTAASALRRRLEKISISDLREKYARSVYHTLRGDEDLVATLFQ